MPVRAGGWHCLRLFWEPPLAGARQTLNGRKGKMAASKWMDSKDYARDAVADWKRKVEFEAELATIIAERLDSRVKLQDPEFRKQRHSAEIVAMANEEDVPSEDIVQSVQDRLALLDERQPKVEGVIAFLGQRFEERARAATATFVEELKPTNIANVKACVIKALALRAVTDVEREWRGPLMMDGVPFSGSLQGMPPNFAQPGAQLDIWLKRVDGNFPEIDVQGLAKKAGVTL